ncbi:formate/nitrite transporter family protein [Bradyrhizobium sp. SZCCHNR2035]|uniref:formate/nitrite transporter family protein n=1 Tax=unclassified Bradyrhizobium TaxID=2631580 RepID=UPI003966C0AB
MDSKSDSPTFNPASEVAGLSDQQRREIQSQSRPSAALIHETIRAEGVSELERRWWAILISAFAPLGYTAGFLVVVLGRQQLFTENTLTPILPLLHHRDLATLLRVLRLWSLVLVANVVGTWAVASVLAHTEIFEPRIVDAFLELSHRTIGGSFASTFVRAVFAGWIIALMMWLLPALRGAGAHIIVAMTYLVALGEFSHIIADSVDCAFLVQSGKASLQDYVGTFFVPTLLGNVVGGTTLVALLNYGQVAAELEGGGAP